MPPDLEQRLENLAAHPRLLLPDRDLPALKSRLAAPTDLGRFWHHLLRSADAAGTLPPVQRKLTGKRLLTVSREVLRRVLTLGLAYRVTDQSRYADAGIDALRAAAAFADWNPSHFLDVAEMTAALGIGYDWLHARLSDADRRLVREAIVHKGLVPSFDTPQDWVTTTNNWNQVCHGGLTLGALAIGEDEPAWCVRTVGRAVENVPIAMKHYAPDGAYPEGPMYWGYGTTYNVLLIAALQSAVGTDFGLSDLPGFLASGDYVVHARGPTGKLFNYSDCNEHDRSELLPALFWIAARRAAPGLLRQQHQALALAAQDSARTPDWLTPLTAVWAETADAGSLPATHFVARGDVPVAMHRSGWDDEATYVAVKGGSPSFNHAHMDAGSFVLEQGGVRWACDLGMQDYTSLEAAGVDLWNNAQDSQRWSVFRLGSLSHNVLTVDGKRQVVAGQATILRSMSEATVVDCTPVYADQLGRAVRGVWLTAGGAVRVQDEIEAVATAAVRWAMVTRADVELLGDCSARLTQDGRRLMLTVRSPATAKLEVFDKNPAPSHFDAPNPGVKILGFRVRTTPGMAERLVVDFQADASHPALPQITPLSQWAIATGPATQGAGA